MRTTFKRLQALVELYPRLAITGGPRTGKTTMAERIGSGRKVFNSDDESKLGWSEASAELARKVNAHNGPLVVEGVAVPRALRKGMKVDAVLVLVQPFEQLKAGQVSMGRGVKTVLDEWRSMNPNAVVIPWSEDITE